MQRGSDKHGPRTDDALSDDVRALRQAGRDVRVEDWRSPEPSGEDQLDVALTPEGSKRGGAPDGMTPEDLDDRAALAAVLGKEIWPADTATVQQRVRESQGPERLIDLVDRLPEGRVYAGASEVWTDVTGEPPEQRF